MKKPMTKPSLKKKPTLKPRLKPQLDKPITKPIANPMPKPEIIKTAPVATRPSSKPMMESMIKPTLEHEHAVPTLEPMTKPTTDSKVQSKVQLKRPTLAKTSVNLRKIDRKHEHEHEHERLAPPKLALRHRPEEAKTLVPKARTPRLDIDGLVDAKGHPMTLDPSQEDAVLMALEGKSFSVIGKAGTGKTTIVQAMCLKWMEQEVGETISYRIKGTGQRAYAPSIAIVAFTNQAANNIRHKIRANDKLAATFGYNITTIHNLLEYTIEWITDPETGKQSPRYYPLRDENNKLEITHLIVEEGSMVGAGSGALWEKLFAALPAGVQIIFLGDINQLTPVIGKSILSYALQQLPIAELLTVHRTALDNPIIRQALRCLEGKEILEDYNDEKGQGVIVKSGAAFKYCHDTYYRAFKKFIRRLLDTNMYNPMTDMILCPYFKYSEQSVNATALAKHVANILAELDGREVYEIKAGFATQYLAVGDRVIIDKEEGIVTGIAKSGGYTGPVPRPATNGMDYFGQIDDLEHYDYTALDIDAMLNGQSDKERTRTASHVVEVKILSQLEGDDTRTITLSSVTEISNIQLGYATSVHRAQGSEYPTTIIAMHDTNQVQLCRESLYTAMTRAQQRLIILAQKQVLRKALLTQRIKGSSLKAKIEYFNEGYLDQKVDIIPSTEE